VVEEWNGQARMPVLLEEKDRMKSVVVVGAQWGDEAKARWWTICGVVRYIARVAGGHKRGAYGHHREDRMCCSWFLAGFCGRSSRR